MNRDRPHFTWFVRYQLAVFLLNDVKKGKTWPAPDYYPRYLRSTEVETLLGDPTKAKEKLGWVPKITLEVMATEMVEHDLMIARRDALCEKEGFRTNRYFE